VQVADLQRSDLGAPQPDLQTNRQDRTVPQPGNRVLARQIEQFARLGSSRTPRPLLHRD
jgi:hypothetical protein